MKKKNPVTDFLVTVTSPVTKKTYRVSKGKKYMTKSQASSFLKDVLPSFPKRTYKTRVRKTSFLEKLLNP